MASVLIVIVIAVVLAGVIGVTFALSRGRGRRGRHPARAATPGRRAHHPTGTASVGGGADRGSEAAAPPVEVDEALAAAVDEALAPTEVEAPAEVEAPVKPRLRDRLGKARGLLGGYVGSIRSRSGIDAETWDELEEALILADVGIGPTTALLDSLRARVKADGLTSSDQLVDALKVELKARLSGFDRDAALRRRRAVGVAVRRGERRGQDHHGGQVGPGRDGRGPQGGDGGGRHVPGRGRRAAGHVGRADAAPTSSGATTGATPAR